MNLRTPWMTMITFAAQFANGYLQGAVNMDWRQVLAKRNSIPNTSRS